MGTLEEFRATFWTVLGTPKGRRSKRYYDVWVDLYLIPDTLAGPLYAIYQRGECDYVFSDRARFPTIHDPETFLVWCLTLADEYRNGVLNAGARDEDEKADQTALLERANGMERLSRMAYEIVKERRGSPKGTPTPVRGFEVPRNEPTLNISPATCLSRLTRP